MGKRTTVYNKGLTANWDLVSQENKTLLSDYITYCKSTNHSPQTCMQYEQQLKIYLCYIQSHLNNKHFTDIKKRELIAFFGFLQNECEVSPNRLKSVKAVISSMSNYIVDVLDDEYPSFRNITSSFKIGPAQPVREKTVFTDDMLQQMFDALVLNGYLQEACFFAVIAFSGARKAEALQVLISDFDDSRIVLGGQYWETHLMRTKGRGKEGKMLKKYIEINGVKKYFDLWMEERQRLGITDEHLFYNAGVKRPANVADVDMFIDIARRLSGAEIYCHSLRHYFVSRARKGRVPDVVIQGLVGWADPSMINVYDDREVSETLADYFTPIT